MNPPDFSFSERYTLNHQSQFENRLTFSLLSRYLTYQFYSVNPKKLHFEEMQAINEELSLLAEREYESTRTETARKRPLAQRRYPAGEFGFKSH
jgi:hypothetical protein